VSDEWLDFTNYRDHPTVKGYHVYFFKLLQQAEFFEILLRANGIPYERYDELENPAQPRFLFAIARHFESRVRPLNFEAIGKYRQKFIPLASVRWLIIILGLGMLLLAVLGYLKSH
jgi:hypothetical protein